MHCVNAFRNGFDACSLLGPTGWAVCAGHRVVFSWPVFWKEAPFLWFLALGGFSLSQALVAVLTLGLLTFYPCILSSLTGMPLTHCTYRLFALFTSWSFVWVGIPVSYPSSHLCSLCPLIASPPLFTIKVKLSPLSVLFTIEVQILFLFSFFHF